MRNRRFTAFRRIHNFIPAAGIVLLLAALLFTVFFYRNQDSRGSDSDAPSSGETSQDTAGNTDSDASSGSLFHAQDLKGYEGFLPISLHTDKAQSAIPDIRLYFDGTGRCFFFLPACVPTEQYVFAYDETVYGIEIDGLPIHSSDAPGSYRQGQEYPIMIKGAGEESGSFDAIPMTITFMQSRNLPSVFISTASGTTGYINVSKENREPGEFLCLLADGTRDSSGTLRSVKCHGNSSFYEADKKTYQILFDSGCDVLSMGTSGKYILQANAFDASYLRNEILYTYCQQAGIPYTVDTAYVDLYFNGEYAGNYLICERVEQGTSRVDIPDGYLIEKIIADRVTAEDHAFQVTGMNYFIIKDSELATAEECADVADYMNHVEDLIRSCSQAESDSKEKYEELCSYIDVESFADMYLVAAISNDIDSNIASTYYYLCSDAGSRKLYAGPVWDYDNAFGRHERGYEIALSAYPSGFCEELYDIPYFRDLVRDRLNTVYYPLMEEYLTVDIPAMHSYIQPSLSMELPRWQAKGYHSAAVADHDDAVSYLYDYIRKRLEHVYDRINHPEGYHHIRFINSSAGADYRDSELWIPDGDKISDDIMTQLSDRFRCEGFRFENGKSYSNTRPVFSDMTLYSY